MRSFLRHALVTYGILLFCGSVLQAQEGPVIGYQLMYNPWKVSIVDGTIERETGETITWRKFESGSKVINAMASGAVQIAQSGSSPIAAGVSRGLDIQIIWVLEDIAAAEALVVRDGAGILAPQDLRGKSIGVPFASTTHFHLLFALEQFGIKADEIEMRNLQPPEIAEAWEKGEIDAAFIWDPVLGKIKKSGRVLITSGLLSNWGKATFDAMVVDREFAETHPQFLCKLIKTVAAADEAFRSNPEGWHADSPEAKSIAELAGGDPAEVKAVPGTL